MRQAHILAAALAIALCPLASTADTPRQIVGALYAPYLRSDSPSIPSGLELIGANATNSLTKAIKKHDECQQREQGICDFDFDIIVCGQDWQLSQLRLSVANGNSPNPVVRAQFDNMGRPEVVRYFFVREGEKWKIDEVIATCRDGEKILPDFALKLTLMKNPPG